MSSTTIYPRGKPKTYLGDIDRIVANVEYYTSTEAAHKRKKISDFIDKQSRVPGAIGALYPPKDRRVDYMRQYGLRYSFHNYTASDIVVVDRLGLPVTVRPEQRRPSERPMAPCVVILREMHFDDESVSLKAYANVQSQGKLHGAEITRMMPELGRRDPYHKFGRSISLEYTITEAEIRAADGRLYHLPTDVVVSFLSAADTLRHPCSPEYVQQQDPYIPNYPTGARDVHVNFRYVNPNPQASPKYVRVANQVFALKPEYTEAAKLVLRYTGKDRDKPVEEEVTEFIEVLYPARLDASRDDVLGWRCHRVTLEEARSRFDVYDTLEDARNPIVVAERKEQQHKDTLAAQAAKAGDVQAVLQTKLEESDADNRRLKHLLDELRRARDLELERIRDRNEEQTHRRRLSAETIKMTAGILTAGLTVFGLWLKFQSSRTA